MDNQEVDIYDNRQFLVPRIKELRSQRDKLVNELANIRKLKNKSISDLKACLKVVKLAKVHYEKIYSSDEEFIVDVVCTAFRVDPKDIGTKSRERHNVCARNLVAFAIDKHQKNHNYDFIASIIKRDRTNIYSCLTSHSFDVKIKDSKYKVGHDICMPLIDNYFQNRS